MEPTLANLSVSTETEYKHGYLQKFPFMSVPSRRKLGRELCPTGADNKGDALIPLLGHTECDKLATGNVGGEVPVFLDPVTIYISC